MGSRRALALPPGTGAASGSGRSGSGLRCIDAVRELLRGRADLRLPGLELLRAEDARRAGGARLVPTLRTYLDTGGAVPATAQALGLHPTTVRYRLSRITAVSGMNLDDPTTRLACALLLRCLHPDGSEP